MGTMQRLQPMQNTQFGSKYKLPKTCKKRLQKHITVVLYKKRLQKTLIFEKGEHFENGQNSSKCKGYSPCKILSLGQEMKVSKTCKEDL